MKYTCNRFDDHVQRCDWTLHTIGRCWFFFLVWECVSYVCCCVTKRKVKTKRTATCYCDHNPTVYWQRQQTEIWLTAGENGTKYMKNKNENRHFLFRFFPLEKGKESLFDCFRRKVNIFSEIFEQASRIASIMSSRALWWRWWRQRQPAAIIILRTYIDERLRSRFSFVLCVRMLMLCTENNPPDTYSLIRADPKALYTC